MVRVRALTTGYISPMNLRIQLLSALALALLASCSNGRPCPTTNACTTRGATQCMGALVQSCEPDSNCCLQWTTAESCDGGQSCTAGACPGPNSCAGKECGYSDSCGVTCESGSSCTYIGCAGNLGICNQACNTQCLNATSAAACLTPCEAQCTSLHAMCCSSYSGQYPHDACQ